MRTRIQKHIILSEIVLTVDGIDPLELFGENNAKLNLLRKAFPDIQVTSRGNKLRLYGDKKYTQKAKGRFESMVRYLKANSTLPVSTVEELLSGHEPFANGSGSRNERVILHGTSGKPI